MLKILLCTIWIKGRKEVTLRNFRYQEEKIFYFMLKNI